MNLEGFDVSDAQESGQLTAEQIEKFKEKYRQTQANLKKIKKDESKIIKKNKQLGGIISGLIKKGANPELLTLIVKLLQKNFTSDFILGILSLISKDSQKIIEDKFRLASSEGAIAETSKNIQIPGDLPPHIKNHLAAWFNNMFQISSEKPSKVFGFLFSGDIIEPLAIHFSAFVMQDFLNKNSLNVTWNRVVLFSEQFLKNLGDKIKSEIKSKALGSAEK